MVAFAAAALAAAAPDRLADFAVAQRAADGPKSEGSTDAADALHHGAKHTCWATSGE